MLRWLIGLALLVGATAAPAQTFPPLSGRVVDAANVLPPEEETKLTQLSEDIEKASSRQFVVATVPSLEGRPIEDYGYQLGRAWGIGQKGANNGIILLVAPNDRKVRIEVGYGLEPMMTDALASVIVNNDILPRFKAGDLPGGVDAGAQAIAAQMKLPLEAAEQRARTQLAAEKPSARGNGGGIGLVGIFWIVVLLFVVLPIVFGRARGRRYRGGHAPVVIWGPSIGSGWGGSSGGGSSWGGFSGGGGGGGFSGGGGSFGGGGASGGW